MILYLKFSGTDRGSRNLDITDRIIDRVSSVIYV